jgi:XapX domain-containing protein
MAKRVVMTSQRSRGPAPTAIPGVLMVLGVSIGLLLVASGRSMPFGSASYFLLQLAGALVAAGVCIASSLYVIALVRRQRRARSGDDDELGIRGPRVEP